MFVSKYIVTKKNKKRILNILTIYEIEYILTKTYKTDINNMSYKLTSKLEVLKLG